MTPRSAARVADLFDRPGVVAFELFGPGDESSLHPAEASHVSGATERRRQEFAAGRMCARAALAEFGIGPDTPVEKATDRSPIWPDGVTGSISHTEGYCVAVVAPVSGHDGAIGLDVERRDRVTTKLHRMLFTDAEQAGLAEIDPADRSVAATTLFSAKEAFYKAQHQLTRSWVGFKDVTILRNGNSLVLHPATALEVLHTLRWPQTAASLVQDHHVVTAVEVRSR